MPKMRKMITPTDVKHRVEKIIESVKSLEYSVDEAEKLRMILVADIIKAIARGAGKPQELAKEYLKLYEFPFAEYVE